MTENLQRENEELKKRIQELEAKLKQQSTQPPLNRTQQESVAEKSALPEELSPLLERELTSEDIKRYGRQLIIPQIGTQGNRHFLFQISYHVRWRSLI